MVVRVEVRAEDAELAADAFWRAGATAVGEVAAPGAATVELTADLSRCPEDVAALATAIDEFDDDGAWQDGWRPFARAVRTGPFLVRPPWVEAGREDGEIELLLDGGRAFGTGAHPSTTLALAALAPLVHAGSHVLDVGCGSGAVGVAAALLGAAHVEAVDVDRAAVEATMANAVANGVTDRLGVRWADVREVGGSFDVVVANLGSPLVVDFAEALTNRVRPHGALVLSGMLQERVPAVVSAYPSWQVSATAMTDGWGALTLLRTPGLSVR